MSKFNTRWTKKERLQLFTILGKYPKPLDGFKEAAKALERTESAVSWQYYNMHKQGSTYKEVARKPLPSYTEKALKQAVSRRLEFEIKSISITNNRLIIEY